MRVACPACAAAYEIPDRLLASGARLLRCAACGAEFEAAVPVPAPPALPPGPEPAESPPPADPAPASEPAPAAAAATRPVPAESDRPPPTRGPSQPSPAEPLPPNAPPRPRAGLAAAWALSFAAIGVAAWAALHWRDQVMQAWPPAARLYQALGLG